MSRRKKRKEKRMKEEKAMGYKNISRVFFLNKKTGETPLELLEKFQKSFKYKWWLFLQKRNCQKRKIRKNGCNKVPLAYAGRLDPMAEGKMLILVGDACKDREKYLNLDKEYIFEILLGASSDTGDILGIVKRGEKFLFKDKKEVIKEIKNILKKKIGKRKMTYPVYSSRPVNGKPLFLWALENRLDEIEIPQKDIEIYQMDFLDLNEVELSRIKKLIFKKINSLKKVEAKSKKLGEDFRRKKVLNSWENFFKDSKKTKEKKVYLLKIKTRVSSGTYMRVLAEEIAEELGTKGLAFSIKRTKFFKD